MPRVRVEWLSTRTAEQRRDLAKRITEVMVDVAAVQPNEVTVVFEEVEPRLMAKGGIFWDEILAKRK